MSSFISPCHTAKVCGIFTTILKFTRKHKRPWIAKEILCKLIVMMMIDDDDDDGGVTILSPRL